MENFTVERASQQQGLAIQERQGTPGGLQGGRVMALLQQAHVVLGAGREQGAHQLMGGISHGRQRRGRNVASFILPA